MQAQIVRELTSRFWLIDHSRPGLDMSPQAIVALAKRAITQHGVGVDPYRWLERQLSGRYRTALQGHKGKPDLLLTRPAGGRLLHGLTIPGHVVPRTIFAELKSLTGQLDVDQQTWLRSLVDAGCEVWIVDPNNLGEFYEATVPLDSPPLPGLHTPAGYVPT